MAFSERAKLWFAARSNVHIVGATMLLSLLACAWILLFVGFNPYFVPPQLQGPFPLWVTYLLLLMLPISMALAMGTLVGYLWAAPYLAIIGLNLIENFFLIRGGTSETQSRMFVAFVFTYFVPFILVRLLRDTSEARRARNYRVACAFQLFLLAGAVCFFTYHYGVRHVGESVVSVQRVRFWTPPLSIPLVEEEAAYLVDKRGRLFRIELASGRKRRITQIPEPTHAELGFASALPPIHHSVSPFFGLLTRVGEDELSFLYRHQAAPVIMEVKVNEETGEVDWRAHDAGQRPSIEFPPRTFSTVAQEATITASHPSGHTALIEGENIMTVIDTLGQVGWIHAAHGWILIETRGGVIIVTVKER